MIKLQPISTSDLQHYKFMEELLVDASVSYTHLPCRTGHCSRTTAAGKLYPRKPAGRPTLTRHQKHLYSCLLYTSLPVEQQCPKHHHHPANRSVGVVMMRNNGCRQHDNVDKKQQCYYISFLPFHPFFWICIGFLSLIHIW